MAGWMGASEELDAVDRRTSEDIWLHVWTSSRLYSASRES
jgi:hypothetical protein